MKGNGVNYQEYRHCFRQNHIPVFVTPQHATSPHNDPQRRAGDIVTLQQGYHPFYGEQCSSNKCSLYVWTLLADNRFECGVVWSTGWRLYFKLLSVSNAEWWGCLLLQNPDTFNHYTIIKLNIWGHSPSTSGFLCKFVPPIPRTFIYNQRCKFRNWQHR